MKKQITLSLLLCLIGIGAKATVYYVDPTSGSSTGTGLSWATAVKTIEQAETLADANPGVDDVYVKGGILSYPGSTLTVRATNDVNLYGSFKGIETTPADRPLIDIDGNGIVEPWEFQYPTLISSNNPNNGVVLASSIFDGFTITHVASKSGLMSTVVCAANGTFQNCIVKNGNVTVTMTSTTTFDAFLVKAIGVIKNCLFEKNTMTAVVNTTSDRYFCPGMGLVAGAKVSGCVFRNNKAIVDCSASSAGLTSSGKGMIVNIYGSAAGSCILSNTLIYNNEVSYTGGGGTATSIMASGSILGTSGLSTIALTDSIVNCTVANNKIHNSSKGGIFIYNNTVLLNNILNNVAWNNTIDSLGMRNIVRNLSINSSVASGRIGYNFMNKGQVGGYTSNSFTANNVFDVTLGNITTPDSLTAPRFKAPTTFAGVNRTPGSADSIAIAQADWRILANSYLIGKGIATTVKLDKSGKPYASTPSVGAYEYDASVTGINNVTLSNSTLVLIQNGKIRFVTEGEFEILSVTGAVVWKGFAEINQQILLPKGYYIVHQLREKSVQKILL